MFMDADRQFDIADIALLVPFVGNGLGVREWAVGLTASRQVAAAVGLTADLVNRAAELIVAIPLGLAAWVWLTRTLARGRRQDADEETSQPESA